MFAPGDCNDTPALAFYLDGCVEQGRRVAGQVWADDNGYSNPKLRRWAQTRLELTFIVRQRDLKGEPPSICQHPLDRVRKPMEGVLSVLAVCFGIERLLAKTGWGIYLRTEAKATAFSLP